MSFLAHLVVVAIALWVATYLIPGVGDANYTALAIGALVLGLVNALVRPVLVLLTLPITVLTLGLFYLVVNGVAFGLAAAAGAGLRGGVVRHRDSRRAGRQPRVVGAGAGRPGLES